MSDVFCTSPSDALVTFPRRFGELLIRRLKVIFKFEMSSMAVSSISDEDERSSFASSEDPESRLEK